MWQPVAFWLEFIVGIAAVTAAGGCLGQSITPSDEWGIKSGSTRARLLQGAEQRR